MAEDRDADVAVRQARQDDEAAVVAITEETWPERGPDYLPRVFAEWIETDDEAQRTFVVEVDGEVAGVVQGVLLSEHEAWAQGIRVDPDARGQGLSRALTRAVFDWAADRGATVCRNLVFSWNAAGLGLSRAAGFEPATEFRWAHPEPNADATGPAELARTADPDTAWSCWQRSAAMRHLRGLALDFEESWALSELTRDDLRAADDGAILVIRGEDGARAATVRTRVAEHEPEDGETERWAEYGATAWQDADAARALLAAVARDAAAQDAGRTRVLIPETARHVSDAAAARTGISDEPDFVLEADLAARR